MTEGLRCLSIFTLVDTHKSVNGEGKKLLFSIYSTLLVRTIAVNENLYETWYLTLQ